MNRKPVKFLTKPKMGFFNEDGSVRKYLSKEDFIVYENEADKPLTVCTEKPTAKKGFEKSSGYFEPKHQKLDYIIVGKVQVPSVKCELLIESS